MPERRLLYLTQHQMQAFRWQDKTCEPEGEFAVEAAATDFSAYLQSHPKSLFTMVTNIAEEGFQLETIPYLRGRDRSAIVERKLSQSFLGSPLSVAISLGHEKTSRRNERLLLAALTSTNLLEPWMIALRAAEARLTGVYSLALLSDQIIGRLGLPKERSILVTVQDNTVRQSFLDRGNLVFSRVAPLSNSSIGGMTQNVVSEIGRLQQYLQSQRMISRNETIVAHVLLHPKAHAALDLESAPPGVRINPLNLTDCARRLGVKTAVEDSSAQSLFLHAAASYPPAQQFAAPRLLKEYRLWQIGNGLRALSIITFISGALFAGKLHYEQFELRDQAAAVAAQADDKDRRYRAVLATFPAMPMDNDGLRQIVDRLQSIQKSDQTPDLMLQALSQALDATAAVELNSLEWSGSASDAPSSSATAAPAAAEFLHIKGTVFVGREGTPRQLLDVFNAFVSRLKSAGAFSVDIQKQPFDVASGKALRSDQSAVIDTAPRAFELRLLRSTRP